MAENRWGIDLSKDGMCQCPRCARNGRDRSMNNLRVYGETESAFCWSCNFTIPSAEHRLAMGWCEQNEIDEEIEEVTTAEKITESQIAQIKSYTSEKGKNTRGISDDVYKHYGVLHKMSQETGEPVAQYYPITEDYVGTAFKVRELPKKFSVIGKSHSGSDLFGQWRFKNATGKYVVITSGEIDCLSAYMMLEDYRQSRSSDFDPIPCLSGVVGEKSSAKQIQGQYEYLSRFDRVVLIPDQDDAGIEAMHKIAKIVPKGKLFIVTLPYKDVNEMLVKAKEKQFIRAFYDMVAYSPAGVVAAGTIYDEIVERSKVDKLPFPPFLNKLNKMLAGGINYGYIVNILAGSGCGKSSVVNSCVTHWMTECNKKVLVVSLEAEASEFGENLLSSYMGRKIAMIEDREERIAYVSSDAARDASKSLFLFPDGTLRLYLLDDRGDFSKLQEKIEECVTMHDIQIVVIDVISDVFSGASLEEVDKWMKWEKNLVKATNCILCQVAHTKKPSGGAKVASQGGTISEEMLIGSGTQFRSAGINIALQRDKSHDDLVMRNTTEVFLLKSRSTGMTGKALELFYDNETAMLWDKEVYQEQFPAEF